MSSTMGEKIRKLRKELKMTQAQLAEPEMKKSMLSHIENGYANPSMKNLQHIAKKLNKPVSFFFEEDSLCEENYKKQNQLPIDKILEDLKYIDDLIKEKKYESAKTASKRLLDSYTFDKTSKIYGDIINRLASCYIKLNDFEEGEKYAHISCRVYIDNLLYVDAARVYMKLLKKPLIRYEYNTCLKILNKVYKLYSKSTNKDVFLEIEMLIYQPVIYSSKGDFEKTIEVCEKAISLSNENNIYYLLDDSYRMLAITYLLLGDFNKFNIYANKAKKYVEFTDNKLNLVKLYHNYAKYENMMNNPSKALNYLKLLETNADSKTFYYYLEHGKAQYLLGNYNAAMEDFLNISFDVKIHYLLDCIYILTGKIYKGLIYSKLHDYNKAIQEIEDAVKEIEPYTNTEYAYFTKYANNQLSFACESLSEIYSLKGDYTNAYSLLKKSNELKML